MRLLTSLAVLSWLGFLAEKGRAQNPPTWPAATDELENMMFLNQGFRKSGFGEQVIPCQRTNAGPPGSRMASAEWVRTAFHDMATANVFSGTGGLDASILYETDRAENVGAAFQTTLQNFSPFYSTRASLADLIALGVYSATRSCGGPVVPIRAGRPDANKAGPTGVPDPKQSFNDISDRFFNLGFNTADMISVTACGHSIGGVHTEDFPVIVPKGSAPPFDYAKMDSTMAVMDNTIALEWMAGTTKNPLAVGPSVAANQNSDAKIFGADGNVTMKALTNPTTFETTCASVFQRMIEVVPNGVNLSPAIKPYEVKPAGLQLTLLAGGDKIQFDGFIRVRTTTRPAADIATVQLLYVDRNGNVSPSYKITCGVAGEATGFDDTFTFYSFSALLPSTTGISSFTVLVTSTSAATTTYDNNGSSFPISDVVMLLRPQSCIPPGTSTLRISAAVRSDRANAKPVTLDLTLRTPRTGLVVPGLTPASTAMKKGGNVGPYTVYSVEFAVAPGQTGNTRFDISCGGVRDAFKWSGDLGTVCAAPIDGSSGGGSGGGSTTNSDSESNSNTNSATTSGSYNPTGTGGHYPTGTGTGAYPPHGTGSSGHKGGGRPPYGNGTHHDGHGHHGSGGSDSDHDHDHDGGEWVTVTRTRTTVVYTPCATSHTVTVEE